MNALILLSGGMDSATALFEFRKDIALAIGFNYGAKHNEQEQGCAKRLCEITGVPYNIVNLDFNVMGLRSNLLLSGDAIPDGHYEDPVMRKTVVPFRNGIMLAIAAGIAESNDLDTVIISNHAGDHAVYPDCRTEFIQHITAAVKCGTYNEVNIFAPYTDITKRGIALRGKRLNVPYSLTWSCYKGGSVHCGTCGTCVERKEALSGFDSTEYLV